ncbi:MAG: hypothetical protein FWD31_12145 [Planctomycetaceae bacterium]|nr:hypothetical protein [Planctomycetaceae bacterium]
MPVSEHQGNVITTIEPPVDQTAEPNVERQGLLVDPISSQPDDDDNPFSVVEEMTNRVPSPPTVEVIDEFIWQKSDDLDHDALSRMVIPKNNHEIDRRLELHVPDRNKITPSAMPEVIRNEPELKMDSEQPIAPLETDPPTEEWSDPYGHVVAESASIEEEDTVIEINSDPVDHMEPNDEIIPVIDQNLVPTLPNVPTPDGDPFGFDDADAFIQFKQIVGNQNTGATMSQTTEPAIPTQQTTQFPLREDSGFDGWEIDSDDNMTLPQPSVTPTPVTPAPGPIVPRQPVSAPATTAPVSNVDEIDTMDALTPVEEFLVNGAKASPTKLMESVELLYKLNKPALVRRLLRQFLSIEPLAEDCQQITKRINPAILGRIGNEADYQPEGRLVVRKIVEGAQSLNESRSAIEKEMQKLLSGTDREKEDAMRTILIGGETSMEFLLERLALSNDQNEVAETMSLLLAMGESARRALQESLVTTTPLGMSAARLLTQLGRASDSRFLLPMLFDNRLSDEDRREVAGMVQMLSRNVPTPEAAAEILYSMALNYFRGKVPFMTDANNNVPLWILREGSELPKFVLVRDEDASRHFAEKYARYATCLDPQKPAYRQLWLVAFFDLKGAEMGSDNSITLDEDLLHLILNGLSVDDMESALRMAMQQDHPIAARVAAELLGEIDDVESVIYRHGSQSALVKAVGFSDRRVRFAALQSIMKLQPDRPYPGSSVLVQSVTYFTRATGKQRAVVVSPWIGDATSLAGLLEPHGYTSEVAVTGRQAMQLAIDSADTELMMLDLRTPGTSVEFLVQDMRADNRTHDVPIAVLSGGDQLPRAERATYGSKMAFAFPRPNDNESAKFVVENLLRESGVEHVPPHIRLAEARKSIQWVVELYQRPNIYRFENIEQIAWDTLWEPELTMDTLQLVKLIPTANAQRMMTHIISTPAFSIETRQAALEAFEFNAEAYGVLIRGRVILDLYDMYNASGTEPISSQQARSRLLDVVERYADYTQNVGFQK